MKRISLVGLLIGVALLTGLIAWQGLDILSGTLDAAGYQVFWLPAFYGVPVACAWLSWRCLFEARRCPSWWFTAYATWIGFSINWLLPVGQVGGEVARARMVIKRKFPSSGAIATVIGDQTLQIATQAVYALIGLLLFVYVQVETDTTHVSLLVYVLLGFLLFGVASAGFYWLQHAGLFQLFVRMARKFSFLIPGNSSPSSWEEQASALDGALKAMYRRRDRLTIAALWRFAFRITAAGETWLALKFLGHPVTISEALILESIGQAIRSAAFVIPGGLGAQEGGIMLIGAALGLPPDVALASSLCKRVRELVLGVPGLIAWQLEESRHVLRRG